MGLKNYELVWHPQSGADEWVARLEAKSEEYRPYSLRFAHVGIHDWANKRVKNKVFADIVFTRPSEHHYADSVEDAKIWVEAMYALLD
jgi:hypothetical protein